MGALRDPRWCVGPVASVAQVCNTLLESGFFVWVGTRLRVLEPRRLRFGHGYDQAGLGYESYRGPTVANREPRTNTDEPKTENGLGGEGEIGLGNKTGSSLQA